jgi:hypothetical protein
MERQAIAEIARKYYARPEIKAALRKARWLTSRKT